MTLLLIQKSFNIMSHNAWPYVAASFVFFVVFLTVRFIVEYVIAQYRKLRGDGQTCSGVITLVVGPTTVRCELTADSKQVYETVCEQIRKMERN